MSWKKLTSLKGIPSSFVSRDNFWPTIVTSNSKTPLCQKNFFGWWTSFALNWTAFILLSLLITRHFWLGGGGVMMDPRLITCDDVPQKSCNCVLITIVKLSVILESPLYKRVGGRYIPSNKAANCAAYIIKQKLIIILPAIWIRSKNLITH